MGIATILEFRHPTCGAMSKLQYGSRVTVVVTKGIRYNLSCAALLVELLRLIPNQPLNYQGFGQKPAEPSLD